MAFLKSIRLFRILGIELVLHWSFLLLFGLYFIGIALFDAGNLISTGLFIFFLFVSVFFHELSHSVVSKSRGIEVEQILLLPIGGVAFTKEMPKRAIDEFLIAIAGPLFNYIVVGAILLLAIFLPGLGKEILASPGTDFMSGSINPLVMLLYVNFMLGTFNLFVPALPMDGGRIARSLLAMGIGQYRATKAVSFLSKIIAGLMVVAGLMGGGAILMVIGVFVYFGAKQEEDVLELKRMLSKISLERLIDTSPPIDGAMPVLQARDLLIEKNVSALPVRIGQGFGEFSIEFLEGMKQEMLMMPLNEALPLHETTDLAKLNEIGVEKLLSGKRSLIIVTKEGSYLGAIRLEDIERAMKLGNSRQ